MVEHVEVDLGVVELATIPLAHLAVVRDTDDVVRVLRSDHAQRVNGVLMTFARQDTVLHRSSFCADIPLHDVAGLRAANDDIRLERIEQGLRHFILARQRDFGARLQVQRENVDETVGLVVPVLAAFAVTTQQKLVVLGTPVHACDGTLDLHIRLENELLSDLLALHDLLLLVLVVVIRKEITNDVEFLIKSALHDSARLRDELAEIFLGVFLLRVLL